MVMFSGLQCQLRLLLFSLLLLLLLPLLLLPLPLHLFASPPSLFLATNNVSANVIDIFAETDKRCSALASPEAWVKVASKGGRTGVSVIQTVSAARGDEGEGETVERGNNKLCHSTQDRIT